ncbi:MAG TPA: hypothetical protein VHU80_17025, partial [Polyangiaceae bacterium]|nr:hypothetical protein [Polyangiaceae bacterium]
MTRIVPSVAALLAFSLPCRGTFARDGDATNANTAEMPPQANADARDATRDQPQTEKPKAGARRVDHVRVGVLGSLAFPRPLAIEGMVKLENMFGVGIEYSALPQLTIDGVQTHFWAIAADARYFPFHDAFFVGFRAGRQHLGGDGTVSVTGLG